MNWQYIKGVSMLARTRITRYPVRGVKWRKEGPVMISNAAIRQSAREVVDRMGPVAIDYMRGRIAAADKEGTLEERDQAWLLLGEVERILEEENN